MKPYLTGAEFRRFLRKAVSCLRWDDPFSVIHRQNAWGGRESVSGTGSDLAQTERIRRELPPLLRSVGARILLDAPCGDYHWMKEVDLPVEEYIGVDRVRGVIAENRRKHSDSRHRFLRRDLARDRLPRADVILSRDLLVHLDFHTAFRVLENFRRSGSRYLLATTFTADRINADIRVGEWRPLNLERPPFNFPPPIALIDEGCTEYDGVFADKALGLWELESIPYRHPE